MKLMGQRILIEQILTKDTSDGGIALPDSTIRALPYGYVRQLGPEVELLKAGDVVLFNPLTLVELSTVKEGHVLIEPDDVFAILEEGEY